MTQPTCATCSHFVPSAFGLAAYSPEQKWATAPEGTGICRRHPPRYFLPADESDGYSMFPRVHRDQACGEFTQSHSGIPL